MRQISDKIFWDGTGVQGWKQDKICMSENYSELSENYKAGCTMDYWIYQYTEKEVIEYSDIDERLNGAKGSQERCDILVRLNETKEKNRFVHRF